MERFTAKDRAVLTELRILLAAFADGSIVACIKSCVPATSDAMELHFSAAGYT